MKYTNSQIRCLINEHIHSERDRKILERRLIDGRTIEQLAEETEMSPRQIWNIIRKNESVLFRHVKEDQNG